MAKTKEPINPFYILLVVVGIVFSITACAYGMMAYRAISLSAARDLSRHALTAFLDQYGMRLLGGELALLAAATVGAMWLDQARSRRNSAGPSSVERADAERDGRMG